MPASFLEAPVGASLESASRELGRIAELGRALQDRLGPVLERVGDVAFEAQALDELVQHAEGLEAFLQALGHDCQDHWRVRPGRAAAGLTLAAQHRRLAALAGGETLPPSPTPVAAHGDFELF